MKLKTCKKFSLKTVVMVFFFLIYIIFIDLPLGVKLAE